MNISDDEFIRRWNIIRRVILQGYGANFSDAKLRKLFEKNNDEEIDSYIKRLSEFNRLRGERYKRTRKERQKNRSNIF